MMTTHSNWWYPNIFHHYYYIGKIRKRQDVWCWSEEFHSTHRQTNRPVCEQNVLPCLQGPSVISSPVDSFPQHVPHIFMAESPQMYGQTATMQPCRGVAPVNAPLSGHLAALGHRAGGKRWQGQAAWTPETRQRCHCFHSLPPEQLGSILDKLIP
jgi:hypothetical protein